MTQAQASASEVLPERSVDKPPPISKGFVIGLLVFIAVVFGGAALWLASLQPLGGMSSGSGFTSWGPEGVDSVPPNKDGLTLLTTPEPGATFGFAAQVTNDTGVKVTINSVTTSWQFRSPQILIAKPVNTGQQQLVDGQWSYGKVDPLPADGLVVPSESSAFVGQTFTIPKCAVQPSGDKNLMVQMGPMRVSYTYAWFFHRTVTLPVGTWWAIKAPNHC
jgi:hypothetical protein